MRFFLGFFVVALLLLFLPLNSRAATINLQDQVTLSGTVPAHSTDFTAILEKTSPFGSIIRPEVEQEYKLSYTSNLAYPSGIQVVASWSQGTIGNSLTPSIDIVSYVYGSASDGYNGAQAVIDPTNRTITWTIPSLPGGKTAAVYFKVQTTNSFRGAENVAFTVSGKVLGPAVESLTSSIISYYSLAAPLDIPPTTPTPTLTPAAPTPTPVKEKNVLEDVAIRAVNSTNATIQASFNSAGPASLEYGLSFSSLSKKLISIQPIKNHEFTLQNLSADTPYFFRITGASGLDTIYSDIFTFKTAKASNNQKQQVSPESIILESNSIILADPLMLKEQQNPIAVVPADSSIQLRFHIDTSIAVKQVQLFLENSKVLGITSAYAQAPGVNTNMVEIKKGEFTGRIYSGSTAGIYTLIARIYDQLGNISEQKIISLKVTPRMKAIDQGNNPIEGAKLELYYFNESEKRFLPISNQGLSISNPNFSDYKGEFHITLPQGQYRAHVSALGYSGQDLDFTIGATKDYPLFRLEKNNFSVFNSVNYYYESFSDLLTSMVNNFIPLTHSYRFVDAVGVLILSILMLLSFAAFLTKTHLQFSSLKYFLLFHLPIIPLKKVTVALTGRVIELKSNAPLAGVIVSFLDDKKRVIFSTTTNKKGIFYYASSPTHVHISFLKTGFEEYLEDVILTNTKPLEIKLTRQQGFVAQSQKTFAQVVDFIFSLLFETLLGISFFLEIIFFFIWSPLKVLPFLLLSMLNILLLIAYKRSHKVFTN